MSVFSNFSDACKEAREQAGLTLVQAEMRINSLRTISDKPICTERSLIRWERGDGIPKIEAVNAMAIVYKAPHLIERRIGCIEYLTKQRRKEAKAHV